MNDKLTSTTGILLEPYQPTNATQLDYNHTKISDFASISLNLHHWVYDYFTSK